MEIELKIGQKLYLQQERRNEPPEIIERTIKSIGKKYFYCDERKATPFDKQTLRHSNKNYPQWDIQLYLTGQEIKDNNELTKLNNQLREYFSHWGNPKATLQQLRTIAGILNLNQ